jgi:hypothetical protein
LPDDYRRDMHLRKESKMTDPRTEDAFDSALSADALRMAAKDGERAAATLLVLADGREGELAVFLRATLAAHIGNPPKASDAESMRRIRWMAAKAMSLAGLDAPSRKMRNAARRYLECNDRPEALALVVSFRPFAEMTDEARKLTKSEVDRIIAENGAPGTALKWVLRFMTPPLPKADCFLCGQPFVQAPHEVLFGEDARRVFAAAMAWARWRREGREVRVTLPTRPDGAESFDFNNILLSTGEAL